MTTLGKLGWLVSLLLTVTLLIGAYMVVVQGSVTAGDDGRTIVLLNKGERIKVLGEMRGMLETVQTVTEALAQGDMATVETASRAVGMAATANESPATMAKLPIEFKTLGFGTHQAWDDLADLAKSGATVPEVTANLGDLLLNCTACHAAYQFGPGTATP